MDSISNPFISQRGRLPILIMYMLGLLMASWASMGTLLPPVSERGIWFYSALASLLLGSLLITPFFTKPVDAISYGVTSLITLLAADVWGSAASTGFDRFTWSLAMLYVVLVLVSAFLTIALKDSAQPFVQRLARLCYLIGDAVGTPRAIFSVVFLFALITYHRQSVREYLVISLAWVFFVAFRPLEWLANFIGRLRSVWVSRTGVATIGQVVGHESPNIVLLKEEESARTAFGDFLLVRNERGTPGMAIALDHVGFAEGCWLRAFHFASQHIDVSMLDVPWVKRGLAAGLAYKVDTERIQADTEKVKDLRERLIGLVAPGTTVNQLQIELVRADLDLRLGSLVEVCVANKTVLYQIIEGLTKEEILQQKNTRGYVCARAKKIGFWNETKKRFESIPWLPQPNEAVLLVAQTQQAQPAKDNVGYFPGTSFPVCIDPHLLVSHNTAILGILGAGKTFLALELVERMIVAGIKVICLDLTNQYAEELKDFHNAEDEKTEFEELQKIGESGKSNVSIHVEEGRSVKEFTAKVREYIKTFLDSKERKLKILNPAQFTVWRQESKPYQNQAAMATLTPCEITRIFTEVTLSVLQDQGMSKEREARCCLVYEEAHSLIPEWNAVASEGDKIATNGTAKAILQGRKFGLGCLVVTQRTANVTKSILNQCNTVFALRVFDATGMEFLKNYIGEDYASVLSTLEDRHAVVFGRASSCRDPVLIRLNDRLEFTRVFRE